MGQTRKRSMRILVTASTFPQTIDDGSPRFVYDLAEALSAHAEVSVLAPHCSRAKRKETMGSVDVRRFRYFWPPAWQLLTPGKGRGMRERMREHWFAKFQVIPFLISQAWATRGLIRKMSVDIVNAHWLVPQGLTAAWAIGRGTRPSLVLHVHAGDVYMLRKMKIGRRIARYVVTRSAVIFADGSHVRDSLDELLGYPSGAILQPMGVHRDAFAPCSSTIDPDEDLQRQYPSGFLLSVGRMVEKKGTIYLVRAMPQVLHHYPDLKLVLIGDGPERRKLADEVSRQGLLDSVVFLGKLPHSTVSRYLRNCRLAIVPSIIDSQGETEGMPTVVLEAMAAGVVVVASAVDGIPDVLRHNDNGWLCREKDPSDLSEKIVTALKFDSIDSLADSAIKTSELYDWPVVARNYMSRIEQ